MRNAVIALVLFFVTVLVGGIYLAAWMSYVLSQIVPKI